MSKSQTNWPQAPEKFLTVVGQELANRGLDAPDRKYLRFPEAEGDTTDNETSRAFLGDKPKGSSVRRKLVADFVRSIALAPAGLASMTATNELVKRALSTIDAAGGYTIPPGFITELIRDAERPDSLYGLVRKVPVGQTSGSVPRVLSNASVTWGTEGGDIEQGDPAFAETAYLVNRLNAMAKLTRELVDDSGLDIVGVVSDLFSEAISQERDKMIAIGNGSGRPVGIYSASGITTVAITALTYSNLLTLKYSVDARYHARPAFRWTMNSSVLRSCMAIIDENGRPIFADALAGEPPKILGVPYVIEESFPNCFLGIVDFSYYLWFARSGLTMERSADAGEAFQKNEIWLRVCERVDGKPSLPPRCPMARTRVLAGVS